MLIRNKYFPYPVLAKGNDSYATATFTSDVDFDKNGFHVKFILNKNCNSVQEETTLLTSDHLQNLIKVPHHPLLLSDNVVFPSARNLLDWFIQNPSQI